MKTYRVTYRYRGVAHIFTVEAASELSAKVEAQKRVGAPIIKVKEA